MNRRGFSLIELLLVTAITVIIAGSGFLLIGNRRALTDLDATTGVIVASLREAQQNAQASASSTAWGVRFDNAAGAASFSVFASSTYASSSVTSFSRLPAGIAYATSSLFVGSAREVVFGNGTGLVADKGVSVVVRTLKGNAAYEISVSQVGLVAASSTSAN